MQSSLEMKTMPRAKGSPPDLANPPPITRSPQFTPADHHLVCWIWAPKSQLPFQVGSKYIHQNVLPGTLQTQQQDCLWMNELTIQVSPTKVNQHRPHQDLDHGPQRSSSGSFSSSSFFNGLCCKCHRDFSVWWESRASLLGSPMFLPLVLGSDMLLPLGQGPQSVLQNIWDHLYPSMR